LRNSFAVVLGIISALGLPSGLHNYGASQTSPHKVEIAAKRFGYEPSEITVKKGEPVILVVTSQDVSHGLRIRELNIDLTIPKGGESAQVQFTPDLEGDFIGHCSVFCGTGHGSMALTLHVIP
jgi:cytochrome c oxidase subunit 2